VTEENFPQYQHAAQAKKGDIHLLTLRAGISIAAARLIAWPLTKPLRLLAVASPNPCSYWETFNDSLFIRCMVLTHDYLIRNQFRHTELKSKDKPRTLPGLYRKNLRSILNTPRIDTQDRSMKESRDR